MSKTEVILIKKVEGLGGESDHLTVAGGYARNYLIPQGYAIPATAATKRQLEALKSRRETREKNEFQTASELGRALEKLIVPIKVKTGDDGKMFGSVTAAQITEELEKQFEAKVDRKKVHLEEPIKHVGDHVVELRLHPEVHVNLKVKVESTTPLPEPDVAAPR